MRSWLFSDTLLARKVGRPLASFVRVEAAAGAALALAVTIGLVWANSPWKAGYRSFWSTEILVRAGPIVFDESLQATLNDAAMVLFFFTIGLEVKRELVTGSLRYPKAIMLPVAAAVGGMLIPAVIYAAITARTPAVHGWAVAMPTDTALVLGVALLAGPRLPRTAITFLLALAVVDDIAVILVIATVYTGHLHPTWLAGALGLLGIVVVLRRARVWYLPLYVVIGTVIWYCTYRSGIHPTLAGVLLGLLAPATPLHYRDTPIRLDPQSTDPHHVRQAGFVLRETVSVAERLQHLVQPWVGFGVLPLFALANAGIALSGPSVTHAMSSRAAIAVMIASLAGKPLGIAGFAWLAHRLGIAHLPSQLRWAHVAWLGLLGAVAASPSRCTLPHSASRPGSSMWTPSSPSSLRPSSPPRSRHRTAPLWPPKSPDVTPHAQRRPLLPVSRGPPRRLREPKGRPPPGPPGPVSAAPVGA